MIENKLTVCVAGSNKKRTLLSFFFVFSEYISNCNALKRNFLLGKELLLFDLAGKNSKFRRIITEKTKGL